MILQSAAATLKTNMGMYGRTYFKTSFFDLGDLRGHVKPKIFKSKFSAFSQSVYFSNGETVKGIFSFCPTVIFLHGLIQLYYIHNYCVPLGLSFGLPIKEKIFTVEIILTGA